MSVSLRTGVSNHEQNTTARGERVEPRAERLILPPSQSAEAGRCAETSDAGDEMARVDRRTVLHGVGVTMCLPWLDSLSAFAATPSSAAFPKRFAVLFMGNGVN